jgi:hypothetical protein
MSEPTAEDMALRLELTAEMLEAFRNRVVHPDIADATKRGQWVMDRARKRFHKRGHVIRTLIVRTGPPHKLVSLEHDLSYELAPHGGTVATLFAKFFGAQQLYIMTEMWFAQASKEELAGNTFVQPRHRPDRKEGLMVSSEDPYRQPVLRCWVAEITRDARGKGSVGAWAEPFSGFDGRLVYLLPPEAYLAAGAKVPSA